MLLNMIFNQSITFCSVEDLKREGSVIKFIEEWRDEISAFMVGEAVFVVSTICLHFGGPLKLVSGTRKIRCEWHSWEFDLKSRKCLTYQTSACLRNYPFKFNENNLEVFLYEGA